MAKHSAKALETYRQNVSEMLLEAVVEIAEKIITDESLDHGDLLVLMGLSLLVAKNRFPKDALRKRFERAGIHLTNDPAVISKLCCKNEELERSLLDEFDRPRKEVMRGERGH